MKGGKRGSLGLSEATVSGFVCAAFGAVAVQTGHHHWVKQNKEVQPIVEPLTRMLNSLPPSILERVEKYSDPFLLIAGVAAVVQPCIREEMRLRKEGGESKPQEVRRPTPTAPPTPTAAPVQVSAPVAGIVTAPPRDL